MDPLKGNHSSPSHSHSPSLPGSNHTTPPKHGAALPLVPRTTSEPQSPERPSLSGRLTPANAKDVPPKLTAAALARLPQEPVSLHAVHSDDGDDSPLVYALNYLEAAKDTVAIFDKLNKNPKTIEKSYDRVHEAMMMIMNALEYVSNKENYEDNPDDLKFFYKELLSTWKEMKLYEKDLPPSFDALRLKEFESVIREEMKDLGIDQ